MVPIDVFLTFVFASTILALTPGPDNIFVMTQSAMSGSRSGIMVTLGLCSGLLFHTSIVALGVATIFQKYDIAFTGLKILGALYLMFLAWQAFNARSQTTFGKVENKTGIWQLYFRGVIMNITNPKVSIFFLAFLPQFASLDNGPLWQQIFLLGAIFLLVSLIVFSAVAIFSNLVRDILIKSDSSQRVINKISALVFFGLALKLLVLER